MVFFSANEQNAVTLPHSAQKKHSFLVKTKEKSKSKIKFLKRKFIWDFCIIYYDIVPQGHYWMYIL